MSKNDDPPVCQFVTFDPNYPELPFDIAVGESEPISFSVSDARKLKLELGKMIKWYERERT